MYNPNGFTIFTQTSTPTVLANLSTLVVSGGALFLYALHMLMAVPPWHRPSRPLQFSPLEFLGFYKIVGCGKKNQITCLGVQPTV